MIFGLIVVACLVLITFIIGATYVFSALMFDRQQISGSAEESDTYHGNESNEVQAWKGTASICCASAYAPVDVIRRCIGWPTADYTGPVHLVWWLSPIADPAREYVYTYNQGRQPCSLKNQLDESKMAVMVDKSQVFNLLARKPENLEIVPRSWLIGDFIKELDNNPSSNYFPVLVKDPDASVQMGVWVVESREEMEELVASTHTLQGNPRTTINQYISPPLLWYDRPSAAESPEPEDANAGKKFHLRVFVIFLVRDGVVYTWIPNFMKIMTAKIPFVSSDYANKDIHLTGGSRTLKEFWWERDAAWHMRMTKPARDAVEASAKQCILKLADVASSELQCYPEAPAGYHLFGADILPDATGKCWFIEINRRPSWLAKNYDSRSAAISAMHGRFQVENIIRPFFGIASPTQKPDGVFVGSAPGALTPYINDLMNTFAWEITQQFGEKTSIDSSSRIPGTNWAYTGNLEAAKVLKELAIKSRELPKPLHFRQKIMNDFPFEPPIGLSWKDTHSIPTVKKQYPQRTAWVLPPDAPDAATTKETLSEWFREMNMTRESLSTAKSRGVHLAYAEPGSMEGGLGKDFQQVKAIMHSALGGREHTCDKTRLRATMKRVFADQFLPATWEFKPGDSTKSLPTFREGKDIFIVKQRGSSGQEGVYLAETAKEYNAALDKCAKTGGVVQEYIKNPLLSRGKKMHLRVYMAAYITGGIVRVYYASDASKIMTAKKKYIASNWSDRDIHISGGAFTSEFLDWPRDIDCTWLEACTAQESLGEAMAGLARALAATLYKYPEVAAGFHVFGVDVMFKTQDLERDNGRGSNDAEVSSRSNDALRTVPENKIQAVILEVNDRPGLGMKKLDQIEYENLSRRWLTWLKQSIVGQHFCTSYARSPIVAEVAQEINSLSTTANTNTSLVQYLDLLRGYDYVSIAPGRDNESYELRIDDGVIGHYVQVTPGKFYFSGFDSNWAWDSNKVTRRHQECGLALLELAHMKLDHSLDHYELTEPTPEILKKAKALTFGKYAGIRPKKENKPKRGAGDTSANNTTKENTYLIIDSHYIPKEFIEMLVSGWKQIRKPIPKSPITWMVCMTNYQSFWQTPAILKGQLDDNEITDKSRLHAHANEWSALNPTEPKWPLAETFAVNADSHLPAGGAPWIVRANWAWSGSGNRVVTTDAELTDAFKQFSVKPDFLKNREPARIIASRYIVNPLLLPTGHKFHARIHAFVSLGPDFLESASLPSISILHTIYLMSSEKPYEQSNWSDPNLHDTHGRYRGGFRALIEELPNSDKLRNNAIKALVTLLHHTKHLIKLFPDAKNAHTFFGADVMFELDGTPIILEINNNPGIKATPEIESAIHAEMLVEVARAANRVFHLGHDEDALPQGIARVISRLYPGITVKPPVPSTPIEKILDLM